MESKLSKYLNEQLGVFIILLSKSTKKYKFANFTFFVLLKRSTKNTSLVIQICTKELSKDTNFVLFVWNANTINFFEIQTLQNAFKIYFILILLDVYKKQISLKIN